MPSLRTRTTYNAIVLASASDALSDAGAAVADATANLNAIADGTLDLDAVTIGGARFINNMGSLEPEP